MKFAFFVFFMVIPCCVQAEPTPGEENMRALEQFFGVPAGGLSVECPQKSYQLAGNEEAGRELYICLDANSGEDRCEISVTSLKKSPSSYRISYEVKQSSGNPSSYWNSVMQIHSPPDPGEGWRCPLLSVEVLRGEYRVFSRWDTSYMSHISGDGCVGDGATIRARDVLKGVPVVYGKWQDVLFDVTFSPYQNGRLRFKIGKSESRLIEGGNSYNDEGDPYIKFGVYKPAGWSEGEARVGFPVCVSYRNVKVVSF